MIRLSARHTLAAPDLRVLVAAVPELLDHARAVRFDDGMVVDSAGRRREGLRLVSGQHGRAGAQYRLVFATPPPDPDTPPTAEAAPAPEPKRPLAWVVDLVQDDAEGVTLQWDDEDGRHPAEAELVPAPLSFKTSFETPPVPGSGWTMGGVTRFQVEGHADVAASPPALHVQGRIRHRHLGAWWSLTVTSAQPGTADIDLRVRVRGAGLLRPVAFLGTPVLQWAGRRALAESVEGWPDAAARSMAELGARWGSSPTPAELAGAALEQLIAGVATVVPAR